MSAQHATTMFFPHFIGRNFTVESVYPIKSRDLGIDIAKLLEVMAIAVKHVTTDHVAP